ncbi:unnamed protein product [Sphagnum troendelagicum]|uniref:Uncharacterized protein n=1 Tax=Sphagnum troendelagicum TaxID=128251 RepID=A0ABP0UZI3_9BRYO
MHDPGLGQNSADADGQAATVDVSDNVAFNAEAGNFKGVLTSGLFVVKTPPDLRTTAQSEQEKMWINKEDPSA